MRAASAGWSLGVSVAYLVLALVVPGVAQGLVVAFVALLVVPAAAVETRERLDDR